MERTLEEWFEYYEKHNKFPPGMNQHGNYPKGSCLYWDKNKGYVVIAKDETNNMVIVDEACGDIRHWVRFVEQQAQNYGCDKIGTKTPRRIRPYLRKVGATIVRTDTDSNGLSKYTCKDKKGRLVTASEGRVVDKYTYNATPIQMHVIIWYLNKKVED